MAKQTKPRKDINQLAKSIVDQATGQNEPKPVKKTTKKGDHI